MNNVVLCPNCGGQKTISKPPYIAGDVNAWVCSGTPTYPCPTCDGRGWIRVDSVSQDDFDCVKSVALSSMETAESLMDECVKRADKIKELETRCNTLNKACERREISILKESDKLNTKNILLGDTLLQNESEIERLRRTILYMERREDLDGAELERRACVVNDQLHVVKGMRDEVLEEWEKKRGEVARLKTVVHELEADEVCLNSSIKAFRAVIGEKDLRIADMESQREMVRKTRDAREEELLGIVNDLTDENILFETGPGLLDEMLKIVNPLIRSGNYAQPMAYYQLLSMKMNELCQTVVQFRRGHNIVG